MYRAYSIYFEVMKLRPDGDPNITKATEFYKHRADLTRSFEIFLEEIENNFYDAHISHQHLFLEKNHLQFSDLDFIFLFEELESDLNIFEQIFPLTLKKRCFVRGQLDQKTILHEFIDSNPRIQAKIRQLWAKDFEFYEEAKEAREAILNNLAPIEG